MIRNSYSRMNRNESLKAQAEMKAYRPRGFVRLLQRLMKFGARKDDNFG